MSEKIRWAYNRSERNASDWTDEDYKAEALNSEAYLALSQARADIITPIVELLRSDVPLDDVVRHALADAFEGKARFGIPISFKVVGQDMGPLGGKAQKHRRFNRDIEIGQLIYEERHVGATRERALEIAAQRFCIGEDSCRRAIGIHSKFEKWRCSQGDVITKEMKLPDELCDEMLKSIYFHRVIWQANQSG